MSGRRIHFAVSLFVVFVLLMSTAVIVSVLWVDEKLTERIVQQEKTIARVQNRAFSIELNEKLNRIETTFEQAQFFMDHGVFARHSPAWFGWLRLHTQQKIFSDQAWVWQPHHHPAVGFYSGASHADIQTLTSQHLNPSRYQVIERFKRGKERVQWLLMRDKVSHRKLLVATLPVRNRHVSGQLSYIIYKQALSRLLQKHLSHGVVGFQLRNQANQLIASAQSSNSGQPSTRTVMAKHHTFNWSLQAQMSKQYLDNLRRQIHGQVAVITVVILVLAAVIFWLMSQAFKRCLQVLEDEASRIVRFDLSDGQQIHSRIIEFDAIGQTIGRMKLGLRTFAKFVPVSLVRQLLAKEKEIVMGGRHAEMSILFADIQGYTKMMDEYPLDSVTQQLSDFFDVCGQAITEQKGTVDKFIGDAIMAFWGAPERDPNHIKHACKAAIKMQDMVSRQLVTQQLPAIHMRIGLDCGRVLVGSLGSSERLNYTALGNAVNLASRLESLAGVYGVPILVTERVADAMGDQFVFRYLDKVTVKGQSEPMRVHALLPDQESAARVMGPGATYPDALEAYLAGDWPKARDALHAQLQVTPDDGPSLWLAERLAKDMPANWPGYWQYFAK
jgi:class 3 adenylate cyclase